MRRNLPTSSLANMKFAVLGLGDSSYQKLVLRGFEHENGNCG